jgi:hypothetical protein
MLDPVLKRGDRVKFVEADAVRAVLHARDHEEPHLLLQLAIAAVELRQIAVIPDRTVRRDDGSL